MGVDCKKVYRTIHFGPAKNIESFMQESGRCGRDGVASIAYLVYQGMQLTHVDREMKLYLETSNCRRKFLLQFFDAQLTPKEPLHLCCDNCSHICNCGSENCNILSYPNPVTEASNNKSTKQHKVSPENAEQLRSDLYHFYKSLMSDIVKRDASGKLKIFTHPKFVLGFSNIQISQVINNADKLFTIEDICNHVEIWDIHHAYKVFNILQNVFCDMNDMHFHANPEDLFSDEEEYLLPEDWNDLGTDEELAILAINEMSLDDEASFEVTDDVPFTALNALLEMSFDAIVEQRNELWCINN
ncbi:Hypothetical predicted protein [Paramuricea clavata]|uniref:ATP-dependent DNA helicase RecQ zinc-binding domain-containing protein n=1 Tax=Paramuricea clavata TaxID=317549 RepID=A0A7D9DCV3_PARCT|nr:Hypothetical predicted protein [Paramuricea clavata]